MSWSKEDISFKKLSSKRVTSDINSVYEEIGARSLDIHNLDIKADPIPEIPPGATTSVLQFYNQSAGTGLTLVKDLTVSDDLTYFATIFNGSGQESLANQLTGAGSTGRLFNFVSDKYDALGTAAGAGYEIKLYDKDGVQITKTDSSLWYFDYQTGILIFENAGTIPARAPFCITTYRYIGGFGITAGTGGSGSGSVGTGYTSGIAYYTDANEITSSSSFTWDGGTSVLTLTNSTFSLTGSTITSGTWAGSAISTLYGGTGLTNYTKGDLLVGLGGTLIKLPVGSNNYFLTADSSTDSGLNWISGLATTGIVSINSLDSTAQTLAIGTSGIKFNLVSTGSSHTFNLPDAGIGITGLITGKSQTIAGVKSFTDNLLLNSGSALRFYDSTSTNYIGLVAGSPPADLTFILPDTDGSSGQVLRTDGSATLSWVDKSVSVGQAPPGSPQQGDLWWSTLDANLFIYYIDGTSAQWVEATTGANGGNYGGAGSGITLLNGISYSDQTFEVGLSGSDFAISSAGSSHTFNLPTADSSKRGLVSTGTQTFGGLKRFNAGLEVKTGNTIKLYNAADTAFTAFNSVATSSVTYSLPATDGTDLQVIYTDGSAGLGWTHVGDVYIDVDPPVAPRYGTLWWNSYEGDLKIFYFDGTNSVWVDANNGGISGGISGSGGSGITSINGLTNLVQFFTTGYAGSEFNISSSGSTHTFNLPLTGSATTGLISPDPQTIYGTKSFNDGLKIYNANQAYFYNSANNRYIGLQAATGLTTSATYVLPELDGISGYALKTDGNGNLFWGVAASGTASIGVSSVLPLFGNSQGDLIWHTEEGTLKIWYEDTDTSQWVDASRNSFGAGAIGSTGITSLNGLTDLTQTFSVGTSGTLFNISSTGSSHTFNIPIAGNGITGLIDSGSQTIYGAKTFDSDLYAVNNIYVSKDNYIGGVPADFTVGGSTGVIYFGIAKGQNINRFAGIKVEEATSPVGSGNLSGEIVFYTDSETVDLSTERLRITGFGTVISSGPVVMSNTTGSGTTTSGSLTVSGGAGIAGTLNASSVGIRDLIALFSANLTTSANTTNQVLHSLPHAEFKTAKYVIQCVSGSDLQAQELLLIHNGTNVYMTEYSQVLGPSNTPITTFDARISGSLLELLVSPVNSITTYVASCTAIRG
jgi:hypothetical protein